MVVANVSSPVKNVVVPKVNSGYGAKSKSVGGFGVKSQSVGVSGGLRFAGSNGKYVILQVLEI